MRSRTGKLILHHRHDRARPVWSQGRDLLDERPPAAGLCRDKGLFDDVGGELVPRHGQHLAVQLGDDGRSVLRLAMLEHELDDVVLPIKLSVDGQCTTHKETRTPN